MKIITLVENTTLGKLKACHGLSLYIETKRHKILFDLGPDETLIENAKLKNIDLALVDTVIISHGHKDHGGALGLFLELNKKAKIYIQRDAFLSHYNLLREGSDKYIGLDQSLMHNERFVLLEGDYEIDSELSLFKAKNSDLVKSPANTMLYENDHVDSFNHEQNLVIKGQQNVLIMGCGHMGILNILRDAPKLKYSYCIGGYHLYNRKLNKTVDNEVLDALVEGLRKYPEIEFYTCHCTGVEAYNYLSKRLKNMHYLACGSELEIKE